MYNTEIFHLSTIVLMKKLIFLKNNKILSAYKKENTSFSQSLLYLQYVDIFHKIPT